MRFIIIIVMLMAFTPSFAQAEKDVNAVVAEDIAMDSKPEADVQVEGETSVEKKMVEALLEISNIVDVEDLRDLLISTENIQNKISNCVVAGQSEHDCYCENQDDVNGFHTLYQKTIAAHPEWIGKQVAYTDLQGMGMTLSFVGYQKQADQIAALSCAKE